MHRGHSQFSGRKVQLCNSLATQALCYLNGTHSPHAYWAEANTPPRQRVHAFHSRIHSIQARHIVFLLLHLMRFVHPLPSIPPSVFCSALHFPYLFPHPSTSRFHAPTHRPFAYSPAARSRTRRTHVPHTPR